MNTLQSHPYESACDAYASRVVARLDDATGELPYDISERLRAARMQALAQRKKVVPVHETLIEDINSILENIEDEDYLFFREYKNNHRVQNVRNSRLMLLISKHSKLTVHKTRTTFVSYLNYFSNGFGDKDIKSLTHKNSGIDDSFYVKKRNLNNLKSIVNSINLQKLVELED